MLIALDIGNSSIHVGFFSSSGLAVQRIAARPLLAPPEYSALINEFIKEKNIDKTPEGIIISSVVPDYTGVLSKTLQELMSVEPLIVGGAVKTGLKFDVPNPAELGSDRIANAVAAYDLYNCPVAAVDFGTATTLSIVNKATFIGGAIMPGIDLMSRILATGTAKLSEIQPRPPETALGADTVTCIQAGLFYGTAGAVERLLIEIEREIGLSLEVVLTGGYSGLLSNFLRRRHDVKPNLTLEGMRIIFMRNRDA